MNKCFIDKSSKARHAQKKRMRPQNGFQTIVSSPTHPRITPTTTASTIACKATERNRAED